MALPSSSYPKTSSSSKVRRVAFYPSCTGIEPHFGHIYTGFANWLLAQQIGAEFLVLTQKGWSMPLHSPKNWAAKFGMLDLPHARTEILEHELADETVYRAIERVIDIPGVKTFVEVNSVHPGMGYFGIDTEGLRLRLLQTLTFHDRLAMREFPFLVMGDTVILARVWGITDMIDGNDLFSRMGIMDTPEIEVLKRLFPELCGPAINQRYIPVIVDENGEKLGSSAGNDADYRIRPLLGKYRRDNLLALAFSALQPWKTTWWPDEIKLDWMVSRFNVDNLPDPTVPIQTYNRDPAKYGWQDGLFQKVTFM